MKYKVSVSTLRRKIKTDEIKFRFDDGKYFIINEPVSTHQRDHRPSLMNSDESLMGAKYPNGRVIDERKDEPILTTANKLLAELKKAYTQILHEKEEQIFQLKEEVSDLNTLVRVLESENKRLMNQIAD